MIEVKNITKSFDDIKALDQISFTIKEGNVFGLIGTNGAGKSTFLRILSGILKPDRGDVYVDGEPVFENPSAKQKIFFISDEQFFFPNATPNDLCRFYEGIYPNFGHERFMRLLSQFSLEPERKVNTFSKGMKKQLSVILGICAGTKYLLCDETFDGLDPVMRQSVKSIFAGEMEDRDFTPIIATHNLRELEDICDHVGLLHKGGVLLSRELGEMKDEIHKLQLVLRNPEDEEQAISGLKIIDRQRRGSLLTLTVRGSQEDIMAQLSAVDTVLMEMLPLSLEEIFISETGAFGYDVRLIRGE